MTRFLILAQSLLLSAAAAFAAAATPVSPVPLTVRGQALTYVPQTGQVLNAEGTRLRRSLVWGDSKAQAFHLGKSEVLKIYAAVPGQEGEALSPAFSARLGRQEAELLNQWSQLGLSRPVLETGATPDGVFYAVMEKPKRGASAAHLVKNGRYAQIHDKMQRLAAALVGAKVVLGTLNPAQVYVERAAPHRALLIKSYSHDRQEPQADAAALATAYERNLAFFGALSQIFAEVKANGPPLSDGTRATERAAIARLVLESLRQKRNIRILYQGDKGPAKIFHLAVQPSSLKKDRFLKGFIKALVFPESGGAAKEYTFRLDRIQEAAFLGHEPAPAPVPAQPPVQAELPLAAPQAQAAPAPAPQAPAPAPALSDSDVNTVANVASYDKGGKRYKATLERAEEYLRDRGATDAQLAAFRKIQEQAHGHADPQDKGGRRGALTDASILSAAQGAIAYKGRPWSATEYNSVLYPTAWNLWAQGATFDQMLLFFRTCNAAPVRGGSFNPWSGD